MSESIQDRTGSMKIDSDSFHLRKLLEAGLVDITALATAVDVLAAKLNADVGVTDEDYSVANAAAITTKA